MALLVSLLLTVWLGCSSNQADPTASVRQAVERHLAARTDLTPASMRVIVEKVSYEGDRASAAVTIVARNDPQAKMQMSYHLRKAGSGWEVEPSPASGAGAHGGAAPAPPAGGNDAELPPGHPPVGGQQAGELPPGHPPLDENPHGQNPGAYAP